MKRIFIFRRTLFLPSETFVESQVSYLKNYFDLILVAEKFIDGNKNQNKVKRILLCGFEQYLQRFLYKFFKREINPRFRLLYPHLLGQLLRREKPDLLHVHFGSDAVKILPVVKKSKVPLVVTFHGYDASRLLNNKWYAQQLPHLFDYASKIIIVSNHMIDTLGLTPWREKVLLLPCCVDVEAFTPAKRKEKEKTILLHSGRLVSKKGVPDLIRVFGRLYSTNKELLLNIVGDGPELELCKQVALEEGVAGSVNFLGSKPHEEVKRLLNEADVFILNSRTAQNGDMEGTPVSLLEAMSMKKAVVSTYHAGIQDVICHDRNGKLVPERNNVLLEQAIREVIEDKDLRERLGDNARQTVIERFSQVHNHAILRDTLFSLTNKITEISLLQQTQVVSKSAYLLGKL